MVRVKKFTLENALQRCLVSSRTILAVNIFDYMSLRMLAASFGEAGHPVIAQCSTRLFQQYRPAEVVAWREALKSPNVWLHLDHCDDPALMESCARAGFDSVMFDGSKLPLKENIRASRQAFQRTRRKAPGVLVECEIGHVKGVEDGFGSDHAPTASLSVEAVLEFHDRVQPDTLAVGFGNMHGHYKGDEVFDLTLMRSVARALPGVPLVLHGGSGLPMPVVRQLVRGGHCKLNISTDLKLFWMQAVQAVVSEGRLDSPLAVTGHLQHQLGAFFLQLQKKYRACLL